MKFYLLILLLTVYFNSFGILFNTLKEIFAVCDALTEFNQEMRNQAFNKVRGITNFTGTSKKTDKIPTKSNKLIKTQKGFSKLAGFIPEDIKEVVDFVQSSEKFASIGAKMPKGLLLVGPPGTGKTSIARAIAEEANAEFFNASGTDFIEIYVGTGAKRIRDLFEKARAINKKAIIFIDELDAIGGIRSGETNSEYRNTLNELLNQMDGFNQNDQVTVIAATNTPESIDPALKRAGRFDKIIFIDLPNEKSRLQILELYSKDIKYSNKVNFLDMAEKTLGFSPAELRNLVNEAAILAVRENFKEVMPSHFYKALTNIKFQKTI